MSATFAACSSPPADRLHAGFLALLPRIEGHARFYFRAVRCPQRREDAVAESVALAWLWFVRLAQRGKDAAAFGAALASLAARAVGSGRRLCGQEPARDVLSGRAQRQRGFRVLPFFELNPAGEGAWAEALHDDGQTPVPAQAAFRIDFPQWLSTLPERQRWLAHLLLAGEGTQAVARRAGLSPPRVSQLRHEFRDSWRGFHGEAPRQAAATVA